MDFCKKCDNMYYMKVKSSPNSGTVDSQNQDLIYYCKYCGYEDDELIKTQDLKVYKFTKENKNKDVHINEYTKYDPTLPHMQTIKCPNVSCKSNEEGSSLTQDVIYMRYDDKNMKYMYLCCHCNFNWFP